MLCFCVFKLMCEISNWMVLCCNYVVFSRLCRAVVCNVICHDWGSLCSTTLRVTLSNTPFSVTSSLRLQNVDIFRPVDPQGHDFPRDPAIPTSPRLIDEPMTDPLPVPYDPTLLPAVHPELFDPTPVIPVPFDHVPFDPPNSSNPLASSSSESAEDLVNQQQRPPGADPFSSSSEEMGGPVALRPPFNFRYQRRDRKKRQALTETSATHEPTFLSDFPSGPSPFRSCPGPARYTTV